MNLIKESQEYKRTAGKILKKSGLVNVLKKHGAKVIGVDISRQYTEGCPPWVYAVGL